MDTTRPAERELVEFAKSREMVAHEAGHAALRAIKPQLDTIPGGALSEAYGDLMPFLTALDRPDTIDAILRETGGDLRLSSHA